ncbi:5-formyltetrahydrofolate cyclo-ligase [Chryseobacterium sp. Leaf180]|uniref:5-formyltetrahydrofolate cyclo-ligase n=1 Tax=Chryseobacterium sp. Leaf180 TaxID=1736289 RepID=UPI0006FD94DC|nr:5-formyltetrahydrofolate cyclo-ligase [Chryseobacterium sp. Leaf180]KQR95520.1 5-formyltetrahydrofolate cyclo-ligase [Chryseobacterium sp. Leaf180]
MLKTELREIYLEKRKVLSDDEVFLLSQKIFENFIENFHPASGQKIHVFLPIKKFREIETSFLIDFCWKNTIHVFVPKVVGNTLISVEIFPETEFEINKWEIREPVSKKDSGISDFDFVITPLLYCDQNGNRVGYGKGFYDSFFETISSETKKIGVNCFEPNETVDDTWENDIQLDYLVTPTAVLSFLNGAE